MTKQTIGQIAANMFAQDADRYRDEELTEEPHA